MEARSDIRMKELVESWRDRSRPLSAHMELAIAAAAHRHSRGLPPLGNGEPVPGCDCEQCTGIDQDAAIREVLRPRPGDRFGRPLDVNAARAIPLLEIVRHLGL